MDFFQVKERSSRNGTIEIYPDWKVVRSKDLMVRGKCFYAIWDDAHQLWSTDEYDVRRLVDEELMEHAAKLKEKTDGTVHIKLMSEFSSRSWSEFRNYLAHLPDNASQLDVCLTFANTPITKKDYVSRRLPYPLEEGECEAYDEIMETLYNPEERAKLEWAVGAVVAGEAKDIQKFIVLFGDPGTGKSTFLNIVQKLFTGYYTTFEAKSLTSSNNGFSMEMFRGNPLVAIDHDSDLSRIEDNTKINSVVAHEEMTMNEKYKPSYTFKPSCFLFIGTNKPVKITEAKAGIIRRLIDVTPTGKTIPIRKYHALMSRIDFELGAIASKCLKIYQTMGKNYYSGYRPLGMILRTDTFFNFVESYYDTFLVQGGATLTQAYDMYKKYCDESNVEYKLPRHKFREELKNYFETFCDVTRIEGKQVRSYYATLKKNKFTAGEMVSKEEAHPSWLVLESTESIFDQIGKDYPAQYALAIEGKEIPGKKWKEVETHLSDLDTTKLHFVRPPLNHIVVDFDLKTPEGKKSAELNLEAADEWMPTYTELSKSGEGLHLHYWYEGDPTKLSTVYADGIEVKVFNGEASLRRKLSKCNNIPIATISSGLPLKGEKVLDFEGVKNEKAIRTLIKKNLNKEIWPNTKPSVDFIYQILEEAYASGEHYDVTDLRPKIMAFANGSTNNAIACLKLVNKMHFQSDEPSKDQANYETEPLVFFDVEVFPNLFVANWKYAGPENKCVHMVNPTPQEIEKLMQMKLVGFNNRRYDNHILYGRYVGYTNAELHELSQRVINESRNGLFGEAYNVSYTDIFDFASKKQSLKKWQIELGIHHQELGLPFDKPVPEELWPKVVEYCDNDVISTEAVFNFKDIKQDFVARQILADLAGMTVNDSTQTLTAQIIFGNEKNPQTEFVYTDLSEMFPGYEFRDGKSYYRDEEPGEGGEVYAEPGLYSNVALLDIVSMHPNSIRLLNLFGKYTQRYNDLIAIRVAIKRGDFETARSMFDGKLAKYLQNEADSKALAYALKIVINIVYGLTSAKFNNKFRDPRNVDNIVAKRGALFMIDLKHMLQELGITVAHIKTDSVKIPNATPEIIDLIVKFGAQYGYEFEHECVFERLCLVNEAVYIAKYDEFGKRNKGGEDAGKWTATGAQFAHPYVFKTLFSGEPIVFEDMCETKTVTSYLYLDMNEGLGEDEHNYMFVGKAGSFCPIRPGCGGGLLMREKDGKFNAATGTKGYRWLEAEVVRELHKEADVDQDYFRELVDDAIASIAKFTDFEWFRGG